MGSAWVVLFRKEMRASRERIVDALESAEAKRSVNMFATATA
jgi:hypothetical protein